MSSKQEPIALSGISAKERECFVGSLRVRGGYESWMAHLMRGLQDPEFLQEFEDTFDSWDRSKLVGQK